MSFDVALNLVWALVGAAALGLVAVRETQRRTLSVGWDQCRRALAVFIASVALFPCVSASDDMVRFERLRVSSQKACDAVGSLPEERGEKSVLYLARLLESLECCEISTPCQVPVALPLLALVGATRHQSVERPLPCPLGRSPPSMAPLD